jgi:hypothetical protein
LPLVASDLLLDLAERRLPPRAERPRRRLGAVEVGEELLHRPLDARGIERSMIAANTNGWI